MARNTGTTAAASDDTSEGSCALVHDGGNSEAAGGHTRNAMTHESGTPATFRASLCEIFLSTDSHPFPCDQIESRPVRFRSCGFTTPPGLRSLLPQGSGGSRPLFRTRLRSPPACRLLRGASSRQASLLAKAVAPKLWAEGVQPDHSKGGPSLDAREGGPRSAPGLASDRCLRRS